MSNEIEKKYLINEIPDILRDFARNDIQQGYVSVSEDGTEVRLRAKRAECASEYYLTIKKGAGKTRTELEISISREQFETLWPTTEGKRVEKTRFEIPYKDADSGMEVVLEIDIYRGALDGLQTLEIEFSTESDSNIFIPPAWAGREITYDKRYKNQQLASCGIPE